MKTLKQLFAKYGIGINHQIVFKKILNELLTQKQQKWIDAPNPDMQNWTMIRSMIILEYKKLLEDLEK